MKNKLIVLLCTGMLSTFSYGIIPQNNTIPDEPDGSSKQDLHKRKKNSVPHQAGFVCLLRQGQRGSHHSGGNSVVQLLCRYL